MVRQGSDQVALPKFPSINITMSHNDEIGKKTVFRASRDYDFLSQTAGHCTDPAVLWWAKDQESKLRNLYFHFSTQRFFLTKRLVLHQKRYILLLRIVGLVVGIVGWVERACSQDQLSFLKTTSTCHAWKLSHCQDMRKQKSHGSRLVWFSLHLLLFQLN